MKKTLLLMLVSVMLLAGCKGITSKDVVEKKGNKNLKVTMEYFEVVGYNEDSKEYPILKESAEHYFNMDQKEISKDDMQNADAIIGFSFGMLNDNGKESPGPANEGFAKIISDLQSKVDVPAYVQWEIAEKMEEKYSTKPKYAIYPKDGYLSTIGVIDQLEEKEYIKKGDTIVVVANYDHGFRVGKLLKKRGYQVLFGTNSYIPEGGWLNQFDVDDEYGYFSESSQTWTKSRANFITEEFYWLVNELYNNKI